MPSPCLYITAVAVTLCFLGIFVVIRLDYHCDWSLCALSPGRSGHQAVMSRMARSLTIGLGQSLSHLGDDCSVARPSQCKDTHAGAPVIQLTESYHCKHTGDFQLTVTGTPWQHDHQWFVPFCPVWAYLGKLLKSCSLLLQCPKPCLQCREAIFDPLIKEAVHPSEKLPLRHLAVQELADHLFQLGKPSACLWPECECWREGSHLCGMYMYADYWCS